jgi:hypothetical protein
MIFELPVTEEKVKPHQITALHLLCAFAFLGTGAILYWLFPGVKNWSIVLLVFGSLLILLSIFKNKWLTAKNTNTVFRLLELITLSDITLFTAYLQKWTPTTMFGVLSAAILFALYWERSGHKPLTIRIDENGLKLPVTSRKRAIDWRDVEQVLLRYGTLTIDCVGNRLFQWNIRETTVDKEIFEAFCQKQVEVNKSKRIADW